MALEADCGVSTVLEELRVASEAGPLATRPSAPAPRRLEAPGEDADRGRQIRNPKFEISLALDDVTAGDDPLLAVGADV